MNNKLDKTLSVFNENKLLILKNLFHCQDHLCGCDLVDSLDLPKNLLSYHIKGLRELGYIEETKCGKSKQYRICGDKEQKVKQILELTELI